MKARPTLPFRLLGTSIKLSVDQDYDVVLARNQPEWRKERLVFILEDLECPDLSVGVLLKDSEVVFEDGKTFEDLLDEEFEIFEGLSARNGTD